MGVPCRAVLSGSVGWATLPLFLSIFGSGGFFFHFPPPRPGRPTPDSRVVCVITAPVGGTAYHVLHARSGVCAPWPLMRTGACVPREGVGGMFCLCGLCGAVCLMLWTIPVVVHVLHHGMAAPGLPYPGAPLPRIHPLFQGAVATMDDFGIDMKKVAEVTTSLKRNGRLAFWWGAWCSGPASCLVCTQCIIVGSTACFAVQLFGWCASPIGGEGGGMRWLARLVLQLGS